ncbi:hypothetical protein [Frankia sp. Cj5]|uniref:hypothetical protein n=1 Tax=Frankia sp. Cj5 TaxID=2880978 RepID=UPI001EF44DED|nr:hypothetical protein [Frankia sp. Cj5]
MTDAVPAAAGRSGLAARTTRYGDGSRDRYGVPAFAAPARRHHRQRPHGHQRYRHQ